MTSFFVRWMLILAGVGAGWAGVQSLSLAETDASLQRSARALLEVERAYFDERLHHKWEAIYARQHPQLQERVTYPYFVNRNGIAAYDTAEVQPQPTPPAGPFIVPAPPPSDKILPAYDALGFPSQRHYRIYANPWVRIDEVHYRKVGISPEGRYGKVEVELDVTERLPPHLFKVDMVIPHTRKHTDYWEYVDGEWRVALMVHQPSVSGSRWTSMLIPNELERLNEIEWVEFDPARLKPPASPKP